MKVKSCLLEAIKNDLELFNFKIDELYMVCDWKEWVNKISSLASNTWKTVNDVLLVFNVSDGF